jgi:ABC-type antimicrobial peptide transport system permease subunit
MGLWMTYTCAAVRLYGVMSSTVSQARRELTVRMALGASGGAVLRQVLRQVLSHGIALTSFGIVIGLPAAFETTHLMGYLLYQSEPAIPSLLDPRSGVIVVASLTACFVPARRASRTDPLHALRS